MGGVRAIRDVIVVGMGPGGAGTAAMLRSPSAFGIGGHALDVLALEARAALPTRDRVVVLQHGATSVLRRADDLLGRRGAATTAPDDVATIARVERTLRDAAHLGGADVRYGARIAGVEDEGFAGVRVLMDDGEVHRARFLVDATGGRLGPFRHGPPEGETVYLTGNLPALRGARGVFHGDTVAVHGAGNHRTWTDLFGFTDARDGATAFVQYPSMPARSDAARARQLLRRHLRESGISPGGLRDAAFIRTPHVVAPTAVDGAMLAVGDSVRRVSPRTGAGVSNALLDAHGASWAIQEALAGVVPREEALVKYAVAATQR